jgi:hypothetical protein
MHPILKNRSPSVSPPIAGALRRKVQTELVLTNTATGLVLVTPTPSFRIITPSVRLVVLWALTFDPDVQPPQSGTGAITVTADAYVRGSREQGGKLMRANNIITTVALPWSLNVPAQGIDMIQGQIGVPNLPGTGVDPFALYLTAVWEPAPGDNIPDDQLQQMLNLCQVSTMGATTSTTGLP